MNGSIIKRGKKYAVVIYSYDLLGVRKQRWISGFNTKKEAEAYLAGRKAKLQQSDVTVSHISLRVFLINWLRNYSQQADLAVNTITGYRVNVFNHIIPAIGDYRLDQINANVLDRLFDELREKGLSGTSQLYVYRVLHKAFETGVKRHEIPFNFCDMIDPPKKSKFSNSWLTSEEMFILTQHLLSSDQPQAIGCLFALLLGLRRGEILGLRWSDIDFPNNILHVVRTATPYSKGYFFSDCKTDNSQRSLLLPDALLQKLNEWQKLQWNLYHFEGDNYVFAFDDGKLISASAFNKFFKRCLVDCKLPDVRIHDLRHSFASYLVDSNVPITVVSQMLGHSKPSTTTDIYAHCDIGSQDSALRVLDNLINGEIY